MTTVRSSRKRSIFLVSATLMALLVGAGASPAVAAVTQAEDALARFRANLTSPADVVAFETLTQSQRNALSDYLLGRTDPFKRAPPSAARSTTTGTNTVRAGDFELRSQIPTSSPTALSTGSTPTVRAGGTRTVYAWQSFVFAGITISKTTVRESYYYSGSRATGIASYSCTVDANYDPFSQVTTTKNSAWTSGGTATAECEVTVRRGVPTPWGPVSWSTRSNVQFVLGNGNGAVTAHGWR